MVVVPALPPVEERYPPDPSSLAERELISAPPVVRGPAFTLKLERRHQAAARDRRGSGPERHMVGNPRDEQRMRQKRGQEEVDDIRQQTDPEEHVFPTQQPEQMLACLDFQLQSSQDETTNRLLRYLSVPQPHKIVQISESFRSIRVRQERKDRLTEASLCGRVAPGPISTRVLKLHSPEAAGGQAERCSDRKAGRLQSFDKGDETLSPHPPGRVNVFLRLTRWQDGSTQYELQNPAPW
eukprot:768450-Hanusia_phi.AAC.4